MKGPVGGVKAAEAAVGKAENVEDRAEGVVAVGLMEVMEAWVDLRST